MKALLLVAILTILVARSHQNYSKLLVTTGSIVADFATLTEVIDLADPSNKCSPIETFAIETSGGSGALVNDSPFVCSGYIRNSQGKAQTTSCYILGLDGKQTEVNLLVSREWAASIAVGPETMWVTGGLHHEPGDFMGTRMSSTEVIDVSGNVENGPELPVHVWGHCIVPYNEDSFMIIGGITTEEFSSKSSFIYDQSSLDWRQGPKMSIDRYQHGCAPVKIGGNSYIIAGGGYSTNLGRLSSVEYLDLSEADPQWKQGPEFPYFLMEFNMIASPSGEGALAIGGISERTFLPSILEMTCEGSLESCQWREMEQKLEVGRKEQVSMLIPDDFAHCDKIK